tara:strand:- start:2289 stop:2504 length:216 start_codon:yes stop_codon:yes gene_type:complete
MTQKRKSFGTTILLLLAKSKVPTPILINVAVKNCSKKSVNGKKWAKTNGGNTNVKKIIYFTNSPLQNSQEN